MTNEEQLLVASDINISMFEIRGILMYGSVDVKLELINNPKLPLDILEFLRTEDKIVLKQAAIKECNFRKDTNELVKELNLLEFKDISKHLESYKNDLKTLNYIIDHKDITSKVIGEVCCVNNDFELQDKGMTKLSQLPKDNDKKIFDMYNVQKENFEYFNRNKFRP